MQKEFINAGKTPLKFNIEKLQFDVRNLSELVPFEPISHQISLTHRLGFNSFYDGIGDLRETNTSDPEAATQQFSELNSELKGTYLYSVCEEVREQLGLPIGRIRLMKLGPKSCLSMHHDYGFRFHIPVFTNEQCYFSFANSPPVHLPATGELYWTNTLMPHSVMNGSSDEDRIHLVFAASCENLNDYKDYYQKALTDYEPLASTPVIDQILKTEQLLNRV